MKKRILAFLLAISMLFSAAPISVGAAEGASVSAGSVSVYPGNTANITISAKNLVNLASLDLDIYYDSSVLTLKSASITGLLNGSLSSVNTNISGLVKLSVASLNGINGSGNLLNLSFTVSSTCSPGNYPITLAVGDAYDVSLGEASVSSSSGAVTVLEKAVTRDPFNLSLYSATTSLQQGNSVSLTLRNSSRRYFSGADFSIQFDDKVFQLDSVTLSTGLATSDAVYSINTNISGRIAVSYAAVSERNTYDLVTIQLTALQDANLTSTVTASVTEAYKADLTPYLSSTTSKSLSITQKPVVVVYPKVYLSPVESGVWQVGQEKSLILKLEEGAPLAAADFRISFDTDVFEVVSVEAAETLSSLGGMLTINPKYTDGFIKFSYINMGGYDEGLDIAKITLRPKLSPTQHYALTPSAVEPVAVDQSEVKMTYVSYGGCVYTPTVTPSTCTEEGYTTWTCRGCGQSYVDSVTEANGHDYDAVVTAPNCTEEGYTTNTCHCGNSYVDSVVPALGHTEGDVIIENTVKVSCTVDATHDEVIYCVTCGIELSRIPVTDAVAPGHSFDEWFITTDPTCTEKGSERRDCINCDHFETSEVNANGHSPATAVEENRLEATCVENGSYDSVVYCSVCDAELNRETVVLSAKGHNYSSFVIEPTEYAVGYTQYECDNCDVHYRDTYCIIGETVDSGSCGANLWWTLDANGTLWIYGNGAMNSWSSSSNVPWYEYASSISSVIVGEGVTTIGNNAFNYYSALKTVSLPEGVISIGSYAFIGCTSLSEIILPDSLIKIGNQSFWNSGLKNVKLGDHLSVIDQFAFCLTPMTSIVFPESVTRIDHYAFTYSDLTQITFLGDAPVIDDQAFVDVTATVYYPGNNETWTDAVKQDYGGTLTWVPLGELTEMKILSAPSEGFVGEPVDLSNLLVSLTFSDGVTLNAGLYDLTVSEIDTSTPGKKNVTVSYDGHTTSFVYLVHEGWSVLVDAGSYPESTHNYPNNANETNELTYPGAERLVLRFSSKCKTQSGDYVYIYDGEDNLIVQYSGTSMAGTTLVLPGNTVKVRLTSNGNSTSYGYSFDSIRAEKINHTGTESTPGLDATCTEAGRTEGIICEVCDQDIYDVTPALGHKEVVDQAVAPSCIETGLTEGSRCSVCGEIFIAQEIVPAMGHDPIYHEAKSPTCTDVGWDAYETCSRCDHSTYSEIPATGHEYKAVVTSPTCVEKGYTTHTCHCGVSYIDAYTGALGHSPAAAVEENRKEATCTEDGSYDSVVYCSVCKAELDRESIVIKPEGHTSADAVEENRKEATCTEEGSYDSVVYCSVCKEELSRDAIVIEAKGHTEGKVIIENKVEVSCIVDGTHDDVIYCIDCNVELSRTPVLDTEATGHSFGEWTQTKAPSCIDIGEDRRDCENCDHFETRDVEALGHAPADTVEENRKEATCTEDGSYDSVVYCSVCSAELSRETVVLSANGHAADEVVIENKVNVTCTVDGTHDDVIYCVDCNVELSRTPVLDAEATGHSFGEWTQTKAPNCTDKGEDRRDCENCDHFETREVAAQGHSSAEAVEENRKEATCTEDGSYESVVYCSVCDAELSRENFVLSANGHTAGEVVIENKVNVTCTVDGTHDDVIYCVDCDIELSRTNIIDAKTPGHSFGDWTVTQASTCTEKGIERRDCANCDHFETREIAALGHSPAAAVEENRIEATCTKDGSYDSVVYCSACKVELSRNTIVIEAKGHTASEVVIENKVEVSCTVDSTHDDVIYCVDCNVELSRTPVLDVEATGHSFSEWTQTKAPNCDDKGEDRRDCENCDHFETRDVAAQGHSSAEAVEENRKEATCTEDGSYDSVVYCSVCKVELSRDSIVIEAKGHTEGEIVVENNVEVSCTFDGTHDDVIYCVDCGAELSRTSVTDAKSTGHSFGEWNQTKSPSCTEKGIEQRDCANCDHFEARPINALGHNLINHEAKAPTCTEGGWSAYETCSRCDFSNYVEILPTGHKYESTVTAPTCLDKGYTTHTCYCGSSYVDSYLEALGHSFNEWIIDTEATCTEDGEQHSVCVRCEYVETEVIEAQGHDYDTVITDPTCTQAGFTTYTCAVCEERFVGDTVDALGHDYGEWEIETEATCTERGEELRFCAACDAYESRQIEATGHNFTDYVSDDNTTCTEDGTMTAVCDNCDAIDTVIEPGTATGHDWDNGVVSKEPAPGVAGETIYTCFNCGETKTEIIPALPEDEPCTHDSVTIVGKLDPSCTAVGYSGDKVCSGCGETVEVGSELPKTPHTEVVDKAVSATCTKDGLTEGKHCSVCEMILLAQVNVPATGHNFGQWIETVPATSISGGEEKRICITCGIEEKRSTDKLVNPFIDVSAGAYYEVPVLWAVSKGITNGMTPITFEPETQCTRGQVVTFLWRASGEPEPSAKNNPFKDVLETDYFYKAVLWAVEKGITNGISADQFGPSQSCTRAQVATFLWRAQGKPKAANTNHPFTDIKSGDYYFEAVLWAVEAGVTNGMSPTTFAPENTCTRGQIVTFLYRALK